MNATKDINDMKDIEDSLRAMLAADAQRLQEQDLRPATVFAPPRAARWRTPRGVIAAVGAAAATAGLLAGTQLLTTHGPGTPAGNATPAPATATVVDGVSVTFTTRTVTFTAPAATATVPVPTVQAEDPRVAERISQAIAQEVTEATNSFGNRIDEAEPDWPEPLALRVSASTTTWNHFLTVRLDETSQVGWDRSESTPGLPIVEYSTLVFDNRTGKRVLAPDLFTNLNQAAAVIRVFLVASHPDGTVRANELEALSLKPSEAGTTTPLSCYPIAEGLHCLVDDGARTPDYQGRLETTVPWDDLADIVRPGLRG
jgi:hypothetical protein